MKQETIEKAAEKESEKVACLVYYGGSAITKDDIENSFKAGAEWQRNHIWHNIDEPPTQGEFILVRWTNRRCAAIWKVIGDDCRVMKMNGVVAWAYIKDILLTSFDEILDENKDVLQRLKDE